MKKLTLSVLLLLTCFALRAQVGLRVGGHLGFNNVFIHNQNSYGYSEMDYENKFGLMGGVDVAYNFDGMSGVQTEINYVKLGQDYFDRNRDFSADSDNNPKVDTYRQIDLSYVQIPIFYRFQSEKRKKTVAVFHALVGPTFGFLISADMAYQADVESNGELVDIPLVIIEGAVPDFVATDAEEEPKDFFRGFDMGMQFAFGADIYANKQVYFTPQLRMFYGFTDIK